jgi:hypothetical protein
MPRNKGAHTTKKNLEAMQRRTKIADRLAQRVSDEEIMQEFGIARVTLYRDKEVIRKTFREHIAHTVGPEMVAQELAVLDYMDKTLARYMAKQIERWENKGNFDGPQPDLSCVTKRLEIYDRRAKLLGLNDTKHLERAAARAAALVEIGKAAAQVEVSRMTVDELSLHYRRLLNGDDPVVAADFIDIGSTVASDSE